MNISKILKQDILSSLKKNLNENNIEEMLSEIKIKTCIELQIKLFEKGYKLYESLMEIKGTTHKLTEKNEKTKICGFGRTKFEALSNCFFNVVESLLQNEDLIDPIKESLKILSSNKTSVIKKEKESLTSNYKRKKNNSQPTEIITNDHEDLETKALVSMLMGDKQLVITHEEIFSYYGDTNTIFDSEEFVSFKQEYQEKTLIIVELEKMVLDLMNQIKKIADSIEQETETYPDYFKCPISWEKLDNPVISMEGHSYEKWAIDKWLINQDTSPITGLVLNDVTLISNYALKSAVDDYNKKLTKQKKTRQDLMKYLMKSEYDLNDLKKYFGCKI